MTEQTTKEQSDGAILRGSEKHTFAERVEGREKEIESSLPDYLRNVGTFKARFHDMIEGMPYAEVEKMFKKAVEREKSKLRGEMSVEGIKGGMKR